MQLSCCRRRGLIAATAAVALGAPLFARAADDRSALVPVQQLIDGLLQVMRAGPGTPFQQRYATLGPVIDRTFDLAAILRESVGAPWGSLSPDQQAQLGQAFRRYTVASYVNSFDRYDGQRFVVKPEPRAVGEERVVETEVIPRSGTSHELDYVMRDQGSGWRAVDVLADGSISRVAVQRSDFRRLLARGGAAALVASLQSKSTDLSDGSS
ncbi:MAG TPA: ABC transporter substrate-binding protein [Rhodopila sp.]|jgi:phospholipid transport system substrate-binding protein|nr:ABC transporter substrate-binding protein [Rhodopila sp.]